MQLDKCHLMIATVRMELFELYRHESLGSGTNAVDPHPTDSSRSIVTFRISLARIPSTYTKYLAAATIW